MRRSTGHAVLVRLCRSLTVSETFTHDGEYPYICALHDILGMKGRVVVLPQERAGETATVSPAIANDLYGASRKDALAPRSRDDAAIAGTHGRELRS